MAFGQSKYYVDSLAENTKRGLRQKVRLGHYPSLAPVGYMNDVRTKTIVVDKRRSKVIKAMFEGYAQGDMRLQDVADFLATHHVTTRTGQRISKSRASFILANPFYVGLFKYGGEIYEGKHEPIISKKLFDQVQGVLKQRGKTDRKPKNHPLPLCGLISCTTCGMMITGEHKIKRQKNGNEHQYWYYRCTKKNKAIKCTESCISASKLEHQLSDMIKSVSLPTEWAKELNQIAKAEHANSAHSVGACVRESEDKLTTISQRLDRLLNGYLDQVIDELDYRQQKAKLLLQKKSLQAEITSTQRTHNDWLEPLQEWIKDAQNFDKIASDGDLFRKKVTAKEIFGSNLRLGGRQLTVATGDRPEYEAGPRSLAWAALRAAHASSLEEPLGSVLVQLFNEARTAFMK